MKKLIFLAAIALFSASCNKAALYTTTPCSISIEIDSSSPKASYILADFTPADRKVYYYQGILTAEDFKKISNPERFMQLCMDYQYKEYINWRYDYLLKGEEYIADFASHFLTYGEDSHYFLDLQANTEYVVYAFCVNPDNNQPMGDLYYASASTGEVKKSGLTFQALFKQREDGAYISIIPSNDDETYVWDWVSQKYLREKGLTIEEYCQKALKMLREHGFVEYIYIKGSETRKYENSEFDTEGDNILIALGYDGEPTTQFFTIHFSYPFTDENAIDFEE